MNHRIDMGRFVVYLALQNDKSVNVSFMLKDDNDIIRSIKPDECFVVIKDVSNLDINLIIHQVISMLKERNITLGSKEFGMIYHDDDTRKKLMNMKNDEEFQFVSFSDNSFKNRKNDVDRLKKDEDVPFLKFWNANVIKKMDNGILRSYIHRKGDSSHKGYMLEGIELKDLFHEFKKLSSDLNFRSVANEMNEDEIANILLDSIASSRNLKKYYMDESRELKTDEASFNEQVVTDLASSHEGVGNKKIGVVYSDISSRPYHTAEEDGNKIKIKDTSYSSRKGDSNSRVINSFVKKRVLRPNTNGGFVSFMSYIIIVVIVVMFIIGMFFIR